MFPGLGQVATGRVWRGFAYAGASVALLALLLRRVYAEAVRLLPVDDPDSLLDPALPFRLAAEIHRANASFFAWITAGVVILWALSAVEAWAVSREDRRSPARRGSSGP